MVQLKGLSYRENICKFFRFFFSLIFYFFYKENGANSPASLRKSLIFFKIISFLLVVKIRLNDRS